jgi:acetoin:2,6-dichlorophenolindophenol oxidoreductase subunit alpha
MSSKMRGSDQVAVCFFGDGALGQGLLFETMNMAALWKLPVIYVCENNLYGEYTPGSETIAGEISGRPQAFGIHTEEINGQDVREVYATTLRLVERARNGEGPAFISCNTYRYHGHHVGDVQRTFYRSKEEEQLWQNERDPLKMLGAWLLEQAIADNSILKLIEQQVQTEISKGVEFALQAPYPEASEVNKHVYA